MTGVEPLKEFLRSQTFNRLGYIERINKENAPGMAMEIMIKLKEVKKQTIIKNALLKNKVKNNFKSV